MGSSGSKGSGVTRGSGHSRKTCHFRREIEKLVPSGIHDCRREQLREYRNILIFVNPDPVSSPGRRLRDGAIQSATAGGIRVGIITPKSLVLESSGMPD
jgi:hypothetical protein